MNEAPGKLEAPLQTEAARQSNVPSALPRAQEREFDLRSTAALLRRHIKTIIFTVVGLMAVTLLIATQLEREFTATALVLVDSRESQLLGFEPAVSEAFGLNPAVDTEVEIARSSSVLARVAKDLKLAQSPEFRSRPSLVERALAAVGLAAPPSTETAADWADLSAASRSKLIHGLAKRFDVGRLSLTKIISVSAYAGSPESAAQLANALAQAYIDEQIESKLNASQKAVTFLRERVDLLAKQISDAEQEVERFVTETLAEQGTAESQELLRRFEQERAGQVQDLSTLMGLEAALEADNYNRMTDLVDSATEGFKQRQKELTDLLSAKDIAPSELEAAHQNLADFQQQVRAAAEQRVTELRAAVSESEHNSAEIRAQLDALLTRQDIPREVSVEFFRLQRDAETKRNLYSSFLTKLRQTEQQAVFNLPDSRVIAPAAPPDSPSFPPMRLIGGAALLLSICAGFGMALLREYYVGGFTGIEQLETTAGIPVVAAVPRYRPRDGGSVDSAITTEPLSAFSEAIRRVRLGVEAFGSGSHFSVFVTSTLPEEGKTTIALALSRTFALSGRKTLLIDADLRHPAVDKLTQSTPEHLIMQYLTGELDEGSVEKLVAAPEPKTGLHLILGREGAVGATDVLLLSERFRSLMSFARGNYDVVVLDSSPVGLVVDPQIIARDADVGLYVVRYASTNQNLLRTSLRQLRSENRHICAVLNQVDHGPRASSKYSYY